MKIKLTAISSVLIATLASTACRKPASVNQPAASPTPVAQEPVGGVTQVGDKYFFRGTIANLSIEMQLLRDGERLTGNYFYPRVGKNISLTGTVGSSAC